MLTAVAVNAFSCKQQSGKFSWSVCVCKLKSCG